MASVHAKTAEGVQGVADVTVAGATTGPRCYPDCIEDLKSQCVPMIPCTMHATPPPPYADTFNFCYANGVKGTGMPTKTGSRHTQRKADGSICYVIDATFDMNGGTTFVWQDGAGKMVATETFNSIGGGKEH